MCRFPSSVDYKQCTAVGPQTETHINRQFGTMRLDKRKLQNHTDFST